MGVDQQWQFGTIRYVNVYLRMLPGEFIGSAAIRREVDRNKTNL